MMARKMFKSFLSFFILNIIVQASLFTTQNSYDYQTLRFESNNFRDRDFNNNWKQDRYADNRKYGTIDRVMLCRMSPQDYRELFKTGHSSSIERENKILTNYELYRFEGFKEYARSLKLYKHFMLSLCYSINHDKKVKQSLLYVEGFKNSFSPFHEKSEFWNFVRAEAEDILAASPHLNTDSYELRTLLTDHQSNYHDLGINQETFNARIDAINKTLKTPDKFFDYGLEYDKSVAYEYSELFKNTIGTYVDQQLHNELLTLSQTMNTLEDHHQGNDHLAAINPAIKNILYQAKQESNAITAFSLSDFCISALKVVTKVMNTLYDTSRSFARGVYHGVQTSLDPQHWRDMVTSTFDIAMLLCREVGEEATHADRVFSQAFHSNDNVQHFIDKHRYKNIYQEKIFQNYLKTIAQNLKNKTWQELIENGTELGTTMILDALALNAAGGFANAAGRSAIKQLNVLIKNFTKFPEQYAVEVAGFGKLIIEEGEELAHQAAGQATKKFKPYSEKLACKEAKEAIIDVIRPEELRKRICNIGEDVLDVMEELGGHAMERHVSKNNDWLGYRAMHGKVKAASTFTDKHTAIKAVKENLRHNSREIVEWIKDKYTDPKITFEFFHRHSLGKTIPKGKTTPIENLTTTRVVLIKDTDSCLGFKILTAYPVD
jgi:hypothetical protein